MRPNTGLDLTPQRSRKQSDSSSRSYTAPTTFFLTRDPDARPKSALNAFKELDKSPVRSLEETLEEADRQSRYTLPRHAQHDVKNTGRRRSTIKLQTSEDVGDENTPTSPKISLQVATSSTASSVPLHAGPSLPDSPKSISSQSIVKSDDGCIQDEVSSVAIASSDDEEEQNDSTSREVQDSAPQLIMPSIKMPSRRPFTDRGKQIGRFKILVAGTKGSGRTSLIKSIVQLCEDIVHVDSMPTTFKSMIHERNGTPHAVPATSEIYASTKPYPTWWSDLDESRVLKRRKSVGDAVLERNICFVDTCHSSRPDRTIQYLEQQLLTSVSAINQAGKELNALLSGRGGVQVDVVLYLISKESVKEDQSDMQRIAQFCNVIPLISKADLLSTDEVSKLKAMEFPGSALPYLPFQQRAEYECQATAPYSVSSANGNDVDNMDASLLMSPEYVQPLMPSELPLLVQQLFEPNTISYLRHTSAKKLVSWYASEPRLIQSASPSLHSPQPSTLNSPLPTSLSNSGVLIPVTSEVSLNTSNSYALAKVADHTHREEHLAQIRLSKWASDLQLSIQRERERYECLAQGERALWLVQRMGEEVRDGQVLPIENSQALVKANDKSRILYPDLRYDAHDPLGLLRWQDTVRTRGWAALQVLGSFGVVGGVALWLAKTWGFTASLQQWAHDWFVHFFGTND